MNKGSLSLGALMVMLLGIKTLYCADHEVSISNLTGSSLKFAIVLTKVGLGGATHPHKEIVNSASSKLQTGVLRSGQTLPVRVAPASRTKYDRVIWFVAEKNSDAVGKFEESIESGKREPGVWALEIGSNKKVVIVEKNGKYTLESWTVQLQRKLEDAWDKARLGARQFGRSVTEGAESAYKRTKEIAASAKKRITSVFKATSFEKPAGISWSVAAQKARESRVSLQQALSTLEITLPQLKEAYNQGGAERMLDLVKKNYRRLAMKNHPDKGGDEKKFKAIGSAYVIFTEWLTMAGMAGEEE